MTLSNKAYEWFLLRASLTGYFLKPDKQNRSFNRSSRTNRHVTQTWPRTKIPFHLFTTSYVYPVIIILRKKGLLLAILALCYRDLLVVFNQWRIFGYITNEFADVLKLIPISRKNEVTRAQHTFFCIFSEMDPNLLKQFFPALSLFLWKQVYSSLTEKRALNYSKTWIQNPKH